MSQSNQFDHSVSVYTVSQMSLPLEIKNLVDGFRQETGFAPIFIVKGVATVAGDIGRRLSLTTGTGRTPVWLNATKGTPILCVY